MTSDTLLKSRGIEDAQSGVLLVGLAPRYGYIDLQAKAGQQPLGPSEFLHALKLLVGSGLKVWPELSETVATVVEKARAQEPAPRVEAQP